MGEVQVEKWDTLTTGPEVAVLLVELTVELFGLTRKFTANEIAEALRPRQPAARKET